MKNVFLTIVIIIAVVASGIAVGIYLYNTNNTVKDNFNNENIEVTTQENYTEEQNIIEISNKEEKTTPNTLLIFKTYYTNCKHYINEYKEIDIDLVNLTEKEFLNSNRNWKLEEFSPEQIKLYKEVDGFCNEHYKLKLIDEKLIIYRIDEKGEETEYKVTDITEDYLTTEDVLKLKEGIYVYGRENLSSTLEDYE